MWKSELISTNFKQGLCREMLNIGLVTRLMVLYAPFTKNTVLRETIVCRVIQIFIAITICNHKLNLTVELRPVEKDLNPT